MNTSKGNCRWHLAVASSLLPSSVRWIYLAYCFILFYTKHINCIWIFYCSAHCNCNQLGFEGSLHLLLIPKGEVGKGRYNFIHRMIRIIYIIYKQTVSKYTNMYILRSTLPLSSVKKQRKHFPWKIYQRFGLCYQHQLTFFLHVTGTWISHYLPCHWHQDSSHQKPIWVHSNILPRTQHFWKLSKTHQAPLDRPAR